MKTPLIKRPDLITRSLGGKYYIPAQSAKPMSPNQIITYLQNYTAELVDDLNDALAALGELQRCCYSGAIHRSGTRCIGLHINGKFCQLFEDSLEDAYHDEDFPPPPSDFRKEFPKNHKGEIIVLQDETLESFHAKIRLQWVKDHANWSFDERTMKAFPLGRVVLAMGYKPGVPLLKQEQAWIDATPKYMTR